MVYAFESTSYSKDGDQWLLAWQPNTYDDGYFWTKKINFIDCIYSGYDKQPHKFTFRNKQSAIKFAKSIKLTGYKIVKFRDRDI